MSNRIEEFKNKVEEFNKELVVLQEKYNIKIVAHPIIVPANDEVELEQVEGEVEFEGDVDFEVNEAAGVGTPSEDSEEN
jgi:hypothetical protein